MDARSLELAEQYGRQEGMRVAASRIAELEKQHKKCLATIGEMRDERENTVLALRELCAQVGDTEWHDYEYLPAVIDKHLARHLVGHWAVGDE